MTLESALHLALEHNEFTVAYQPQCDIKTGELLGIEALVRWRRPDDAADLVSAFRFIAAAEESGIIVQLDQFVMRQAFRQMKQWLDSGKVNAGVTLSVNMSAKLFDNEDIPHLVGRILDESGLPADAIEVEVTESIMMRDVSRTTEVLSQLRQLGVKVAIDDFGTGYSSLAYLRNLPISRLKIDRMFVLDAPIKDNDAAITQTIVALAESLKLDVLAEGVETQAQSDFLLDLGCHAAQGYWFSEPLLAGPFEDFLRKSQVTDG